jgi:tetratricopeptide (TPR) repeat protein
VNQATGTPRVFVSYSHDSQGHRENVADFVQELRRQGINAWVDQFVESTPPLSWPAWMADQIDEADFVLLVITETYVRRFRRHEEPGRGLGVRWEGAIITSELYYDVHDRVKFIPVIVSPTDVRLIPPPLSLTTWYVIGTPGNRELAPLLRHLRGEPALIPDPLGTAPGTGINSRSAEAIDSSTAINQALERARSDREAAKDDLRRLVGELPGAASAQAAYALGRLEQEDDLYTAAITAYQRVLDFGPDTPVAEDAARNLQVVVEAMNAHFAPDGPVAAAQNCLALVQRGRMKQLWEELESNLRLVLAQAWIFANRDHPRLAGLDRDELATELAKPRPRHRLTRDFFATQLDEFRHAYRAYDEETWGAAERPRRFGLDYELVILMETGGDGIDWQPDMSRPSFPFLLRRVLGRWRIANFKPEFPTPGWPPTSGPLPLEGVEFTPRNGE